METAPRAATILVDEVDAGKSKGVFKLLRCPHTPFEEPMESPLTTEASKLEHGSSGPTLVEAADLSDRNQLHLLATRQSDAAVGTELNFDLKREIADAFLHAVVAQAGDEGSHLPVAVRNLGDQPSATRAAPAQSCHIG